MPPIASRDHRRRAASARAKQVRARKLLPLAAVALAAACGTTVPGATGAAPPPGLSGDGLTAPSDPAALSSEGGFAGPSGTGSDAGSVSGTLNEPGAGPMSGPDGRATSTSTSTSTGTSPSTAAAAAGTTQPVKVGFVIAPQSFDSAAEAAGFSALQVGDQKAQAQVVVDDINARGGLAGRRLQAVFHEPNSSSGNYEEADQGTCTAFTQDARVAFVISTVVHTELLHSCLSKAGVPLLDNVLYLYDAKIVNPDFLFMPSSWLLDRLMRNEIDALARMGFFKDPGEVGVLLYDLPSSNRVLQNTVLPRLARYGKTKVSVASSPFTTEGAVNQQGNVLKFRSDGVTRVINIAFTPIGFMIAAESQGYRPRYALDSTIGPSTVSQSVPAAQLNGMVGVGWIPSSDIGSGTPVTPAGERCLALMKKAGEDTSNSTTASLMQQFCDAGWFLQAATKAAGDASAAGLVRGARLTKAYVSASSFGADMTLGRPDGLSRYRDFAYQAGCSCIQYVGGLRTAS